MGARPPSCAPSHGLRALALLDDDRKRTELLAENDRLRRELLKRRSHSPMWPVIGGLAAHIALRPLLDPWLNAGSDAKVATAAIVLAVPVVFAVVMLARALMRPPS
jgi:hypothetical protein